MRIIVLLLLSMSGLSAAAAGALATTPDAIHAAAERFMQGFVASLDVEGYESDYTLGSLDPRLQLAACQDELTVSFTGDPWRSTQPSLQVACEDGQRPWRLFIGTSLTIRGTAWVAARPLNRGDRIDASALERRPAVLNALRREAITEREQLEGMEMRRAVSSGTVFTPDLISSPDAVARGDHVIIVARSGTFAVQSRGRALANARVGEQVLVENLASSRRVRGTVTAPGRVEIPM